MIRNKSDAPVPKPKSLRRLNEVKISSRSSESKQEIISEGKTDSNEDDLDPEKAL